jgi:hypothetical protein
MTVFVFGVVCFTAGRVYDAWLEMRRERRQ